MLSSPVAPQVLAEAVRHATAAAPAHVRHLPDLLQRLEHAGLPNSALVHVGWAVRQLGEPDGYLIATVQEALLQCYGGQAFALEVDRHSDRFRQRPRSPPPDPEGGLTGAADAPGSAEAPSRHGAERENASAAPAPPGHPTLEEDRAAADSDGTEGAAAAPAARPAGTSATLTREAGRWLDTLDLLANFRSPVPTLQTVPRFLVAGVRQALVVALEAIRAAHEGLDEVA